MRKLLVLLLLGFLFSNARASYAELIDYGNYLIYDTDLNITWFGYTEYPRTHRLGAMGKGRLTWNEALRFADEFVYAGFDDWRLPTTVDGFHQSAYDGSATAGFNYTNSEMGHLYYVELGNLGYTSPTGYQGQAGWGLNNVGPFSGLLPEVYWSGTNYALFPNTAWSFNFRDGNQETLGQSGSYNVLLVRDGSPVPIPGAVWLLGSGLAGLITIRRKKKISKSVSAFVTF